MADEEKVDEKGSETSEEIGLNWMKALFIGVDESKDEDVVSNNDKEVRVVTLKLHVNKCTHNCNPRFKY